VSSFLIVTSNTHLFFFVIVIVGDLILKLYVIAQAKVDGKSLAAITSLSVLADVTSVSNVTDSFTTVNAFVFTTNFTLRSSSFSTSKSIHSNVIVEFVSSISQSVANTSSVSAFNNLAEDTIDDKLSVIVFVCVNTISFTVISSAVAFSANLATSKSLQFGQIFIHAGAAIVAAFNDKDQVAIVITSPSIDLGVLSVKSVSVSTSLKSVIVNVNV
jgi:hypothetical protein